MHQMTCLSPGLSVLSYLLHLIPTDASFLKSLLMTLHQFCHRRPGLLQNLSDSNCCAWLGIHGSPSMRHVQVNSVTGIWWLLPTCIVQMSLSLSCSTLCPSQNASLPSVVHCFEQFYLFIRAVLFEWLQTDHISGLYSKIVRINSAYNLVFTDKLLFLLFHIFG